MNAFTLERKNPVFTGAVQAGVLTGIGFALIYIFSSKSVTLSSKEWTCVASQPYGIEAKCIEYKAVRELGK